MHAHAAAESHLWYLVTNIFSRPIACTTEHHNLLLNDRMKRHYRSSEGQIIYRANTTCANHMHYTIQWNDPLIE